MTQTKPLSRIEKEINTIQEFVGTLMEREESSVRQGNYCSIVEMLDELKKSVNSDDELIGALKYLVEKTNHIKLNIRKDFDLINARAYASKMLHKAGAL